MSENSIDKFVCTSDVEALRGSHINLSWPALSDRQELTKGAHTQELHKWHKETWIWAGSLHFGVLALSPKMQCYR